MNIELKRLTCCPKISKHGGKVEHSLIDYNNRALIAVLMYIFYVLQKGVVRRLKAIFNMLLLNIGLHAVTTMTLCHQVMLFDSRH